MKKMTKAIVAVVMSAVMLFTAATGAAAASVTEDSADSVAMATVAQAITTGLNKAATALLDHISGVLPATVKVQGPEAFADYADDNLQKTYSQYITNFDNYLEKVNIAITNVGSTSDRLELTQTRVDNQQSTVEELKSLNEDRSISDIIIDYTAAYNAYQASLTGASKVGERTLLDYL